MLWFFTVNFMLYGASLIKKWAIDTKKTFIQQKTTDKNIIYKNTYPHVQISQIQSSFLFFPVPIFPRQIHMNH